MSNTVHRRKLGLRPPKNAPALVAARFLTRKVPAHPVAADQLARLGGGWQMLGNDRAGVCAPVTWANFRRLMTGVLGDVEVYPTQEQVWEIYRTQNPDFDPDGTADTNGPGSDADGGMDLQTLLEYLVKVGGPDGVKAVAFARVNPHDVEEVKAAIAIFGALWTGVSVQEAQQEQFSQGKPWDYDPRSPDEGGHSILTGGYGPQGSAPGPLGGDERFITWAEETSFTDRYWGHKVNQLYLVVWPEHLKMKAFLEGVDRTILEADYQALTNRRMLTEA